MEEKIFEKDFSYRARVNGKDGVITVRPEEKGKPTKKNVVQVGKAQMWSTTGKRNPRRFVQLEASEKAGDLIGEMKEQFQGKSEKGLLLLLHVFKEALDEIMVMP